MKFLVVFGVILICAVAQPIEGEREEDAWIKKSTFSTKGLLFNLLVNLPDDVLQSNKLDLEKLCREATSEPDEQLECLKLKEEVAAEKDALFLKKLMMSQEFAGDANDSNEVPDTKNLAFNDFLPRKLYKRVDNDQMRVAYRKCYFNPVTCF